MAEQTKKTLQEELALLEVRNRVLNEFNSAQDLLAEKLRIQLGFADQSVTKLAEELATLKEGTEEYDKIGLKLQIALQNQTAISQKIEEINEGLKKQKELQESLDDLSETTAANFENIAQQLGILESEFSPFVKQFRSFGKALQKSVKEGKGLKGVFAAAGGGAASAFKSVFSFSNIAGVAISNTTELTNRLIAADKSMVSFGLSAAQAKAATGALRADFFALGGDANGAAMAMNTLASTSALAAKRLGKDFAQDLALFANAGLDSATSANVLSESMIREGMSAAEAKERLGDLVAISRDLGEPVNKAAQEFVQFGSRIKMVGPAAVKEFAKLKAISASTGVEVGKLLSISEGFTTFEDSARAVQQLNVVLGSNLSSVAMMNMSETERIQTIQEAVRAQGGLNNLNQHQIRLLEETIPGNLTMTEIMGLSNEVQVKATDTTADNANQLDKLQKQPAKVAGAMENMRNKTAASASGMAQELKDKSQQIGESVSHISESFIQVGAVIAGVFSAATFLISTFGGSFASVGATAPAAGAGIAAGATAASGGLAALGTAGAIAIPVLLSMAAVFGTFALAVGAIGLTIFKIAEGIGLLIDKTKGMTISSVAGFARFATNMGHVTAALSRANLPAVREMTALINASTTAATGVGAGGGNGGNLTVNLTLDGKVIDRKIIKTVNGALTSV